MASSGQHRPSILEGTNGSTVLSICIFTFSTSPWNRISWYRHTLYVRVGVRACYCIGYIPARVQITAPRNAPCSIYPSSRTCIFSSSNINHNSTFAARLPIGHSTRHPAQSAFLPHNNKQLEMPTNTAKCLHGKTVLTTGASSGIGRSCAFEFARTCPHSLNLILTARRVDRLHSIAAQI